MTEVKNEVEKLRADNVALEKRVRALEALLQDKEVTTVALRENKVQEDHLRRVLLAIRNVNQLILQESDPRQLIELACINLTETMGYDDAWIAIFDREDGSIMATGAICDTDELEAELAQGHFPPCIVQALEQYGVTVIQDSRVDCGGCFLDSVETSKSILIQQLTFGGKSYGVLAVSVPVPYAYSEEEHLFFGEIAGDLAFALHKIETNEALTESQRRYREIFEGSRDGYVVVDTDGRILSANQAFCAMVGYTLDELREMDNFYRITPERWHRWEAEEIWNERLLTRGYSGLYEKEYIHKDGHVFPVELQGYTVLDAEGTPRYLWGVARNITERKRAEEALRESESNYRNLTDTTIDWVFQVDAQGVYTYVSPSVEQIMGYSVEEVLGRTPFDFMAPEEAARLRPIYQEAVATQSRITALEDTLLSKNGDPVHFETNAIPVLDEAREMVGYFGTCRDVTARKRLEQQLSRHQRLIAVGQLATGIAHDFRNLLTTIILYAQMTLSQPAMPAKATRHVGIILSESNKAVDLIQQILDFSSRSMMKTQLLDLRLFLKDVAGVLEHTLPENIRIAVETGAEDYVIKADPGRIRQALLNLALNSRDAMPKGGDLQLRLSKIRIEQSKKTPVAGMASGTWICLAISDTGMGMTEKVYAHLFEPFFTTKEVGKGTGLGLAQVYGIIRQHEGYIDVKTESEAGTTFYIYLPHVSGTMQRVEEQETPAVPQGKGETILLVEDNDVLREVGRELLESLGYRILTAENGREALKICKQRGTEIALVITDIVMPKMGGEELLHELRRRGQPTKVLAITGYAAESVPEGLLRLGFADVIQKPFELEVLAQSVRRILETG